MLWGVAHCAMGGWHTVLWGDGTLCYGVNIYSIIKSSKIKAFKSYAQFIKSEVYKIFII